MDKFKNYVKIYIYSIAQSILLNILQINFKCISNLLTKPEKGQDTEENEKEK